MTTRRICTQRRAQVLGGGGTVELPTTELKDWDSIKSAFNSVLSEAERASMLHEAQKLVVMLSSRDPASCAAEADFPRSSPMRLIGGDELRCVVVEMKSGAEAAEEEDAQQRSGAAAPYSKL